MNVRSRSINKTAISVSFAHSPIWFNSLFKSGCATRDRINLVGWAGFCVCHTLECTSNRMWFVHLSRAFLPFESKETMAMKIKQATSGLVSLMKTSLRTSHFAHWHISLFIRTNDDATNELMCEPEFLNAKMNMPRNAREWNEYVCVSSDIFWWARRDPTPDWYCCRTCYALLRKKWSLDFVFVRFVPAVVRSKVKC